MMTNKFSCSRCGCCCARVGQIISDAQKMIESGNIHPALQEYTAFPYEINPDGSCSMLTEDNLCSVYESRPVMCNVTEMYNRHYAKDMDEGFFVKLLVAECNKAMKQDGINEKYFITT